MASTKGSTEKKSSGQISKLTIESYQKGDFSGSKETFSVMINPVTYTNEMGITYCDPSLIAEMTPSYRGYKKNLVKIKFTLDGTGVVEELQNSNSVSVLLDDLEKKLYKYQGSTHEPPYIKLIWGTLNFPGRLENMLVTSKSFNNDGAPLRAEIELSVLRFIDIETEEKNKNTSSPDLSHLFTLKAGESLPQLCLKVYGSTAYVDEVARINGLSSFRNIKPGTQLLLPPLENKKNLN